MCVCQYDDLEGRVVLAYTDGSRYEGFFKNGTRHGPGRWIMAGCTRRETAVRYVEFENGKEKVN